MDFFEQQARAHRRTKWLVVYFAAAVAGLITAVYFISLVIFAGVQAKQHHSYDNSMPVQFVLWDPKIFFGATVGVLAVIFLGSAYKTNELSAGGSAVATLMGGRLVNQNTTDANERKLLNVVEEMAIASGVPMPQVYVLNDERGINAFAAGHTTGDAAIGVTRGCIELLSRDELQGVIGHEFSHILNGDMRLNLRLIGIIFGLLCIATIGRILLYTRSSSSRDKNPLPILGLALIALGAIGVFFGRLIQAAVSRQREFLADASSVQFTRNPSGLSGALQKIGRYSYGSKLESEHAPDLCHMFFGNGLRDSLFGAFATHPPIPDRIHAIDPTWDGKFPPLKPEQIEAVKQAALSEFEAEHQRSWFLGAAAAAAAQETAPRQAGVPFLEPIQTSKLRPPVIRANSVLPNLGNPTPLHLKYAEQLRDSLPESLRQAARDSLSATALIYALLLSGDEKARAEQLLEISHRVSNAVAEKTTALFTDVAAVAKRARLPLVNLAVGSLRNLTAQEYDQFSSTLDWLIGSDGKVELFEFVLQKIIRHHLTAKFIGAKPPTVQFYTLKPLVPDCAVILSALAYAGSNQPDEIQKAFDTGAPYLRAPVDAPLALLTQEQCGVAALDTALNRLALAVPIIKKNLLEASAHVIGADGVIVENEAELLRAVADTLDCPIPPLGVLQ
jgi:Zn-dependent protease with chaperone function